MGRGRDDASDFQLPEPPLAVKLVDGTPNAGRVLAVAVPAGASERRRAGARLIDRTPKPRHRRSGRRADAVACLGGVEHPVAIRVAVASVADAVAVAVPLVGVRDRRAIVASVSYAIVITVRLAGISNADTVVAGVAHAIAVAIGLVGVCHVRAVVDIVVDAVAIGVARQTVEAHGALAAREHLIARRNPPGDYDGAPYHRAAKAGPRDVQ